MSTSLLDISLLLRCSICLLSRFLVGHQLDQHPLQEEILLRASERKPLITPDCVLPQFDARLKAVKFASMFFGIHKVDNVEEDAFQILFRPWSASECSRESDAVFLRFCIRRWIR